jgi:transposase
MSRAKLVITAVVVEGRSQAEVAGTYEVSKGWVSKLVARYRSEGEAAFEPRSRRPKTSPTAIDDAVVELIVRLRKQLADQGLDAGPDTIAWHLQHHHQTTVSPATISRYLTRRGMVVPEPKKRPKSSYIRFQATLPNECWQADFTHYRLTNPDGTPGDDTEILSWLDDCSRYALSVTAHDRVTGPIVLSTFRKAAGQHGIPASTLTDNGMVFTTRLSGGKGGRNGLEAELHRLHITQKNSRPNHPQTCGKVERFQQTLKKWLTAQPAQPVHAGRAAGPARRLRRRLQPPPTPPVPVAPSHPRHRLHHPDQGAARRQPRRRHPRPDPARPHRRLRLGHPARGRPATPHRYRPNPRPNPRHHARPRPRHPRRPRHHRRTPPRTGPRPDPRLPNHRGTQGPHKTTKPPHLRVQGFPIS